MPIPKKPIHQEKVAGNIRDAIHSRIAEELAMGGSHGIDGADDDGLIDPGLRVDPIHAVYHWHDMFVLQATGSPQGGYTSRIRSIDELLERDKIREEDGFPRKIRIGRMVKPGRGGKDKVVVVPTTVEEKLIHDPSLAPNEEESAGGAGDGEEGEVIGEQPVRQVEASGAGSGEGG